MDRNIWYTIHHYFSEWGTDGKASGETFGVAYYSDNKNAIDMNTPVKTYISGEKGLIKFIRKDNIIFERVE
jgi:hypothetical protein